MQVLRLMAKQMWSEVAEGGRAVRLLSGGLRIAVKIDGQTRQLGLSRGIERVDYQEAGICKHAFDVPGVARPDEITMLGQTWKIYTWQVEPAAQLGFDLDSPAERGEVVP